MRALSLILVLASSAVLAQTTPQPCRGGVPCKAASFTATSTTTPAFACKTRGCSINLGGTAADALIYSNNASGLFFGASIFGFYDGQDGPSFVVDTGGTYLGSWEHLADLSLWSTDFASNPHLRGTSEFTLSTSWLNGNAATQTLGGHKLGAQAFTITAATMYVSGAASGAGNTVLRVYDGTNACDVTFSCTTVSNTLGVKRAAAVATAGVCDFAANASLQFSVQTAGCATTQPTIKNIDWIGIPK